MGFFNKLFGKKKKETLKTTQEVSPVHRTEEATKVSFTLPENEIVCFPGEVLDATSPELIERYKHNLKILIAKAKKDRKVDTFKLIREDDFFPIGWEWRVLSKNTEVELGNIPLSLEVRDAYALEQHGYDPYKKSKEMFIPHIQDRNTVIQQCLKGTDINLAAILLPARFRSTKHFTINTPLEVTGSYNQVPMKRDYIIIDDIDSFLSSGYAYSVAYRDAYLDISHESLPISPNAVVLIDDEKYERIVSDERIAKELEQRRVIRYRGDEAVAINMILTEMGVLPSQVSPYHAEYDSDIRSILETSISNLAKNNQLLFQRGHASVINPKHGHFSSYYDDKNKDYESEIEEFYNFLRAKFPEHLELLKSGSVKNNMDIVYEIGTENLLQAIREYNESVQTRIEQRREEYINDRKSITPDIHQIFVDTVALINCCYKDCENYGLYSEAEESIRKFFQAGTVAEQLEAAQVVGKLLPRPPIHITTAAENALYTCSVEEIMGADRTQKDMSPYKDVPTVIGGRDV